MNVVVLSLTTRQSPLPSGVTPGKFRFILTDSSGTPQTIDADGASASFSSVADGSFSATCQRLDADGNPFGNMATCSGTTTAPPPAMFDEPDSIVFVINPAQ